MTQTSNIETNRLVLRLFSESDAPDVFESCKNPNLGNNAGWKPLETIEETIDVLNTIFIGKEGVWAIVSKETQQVIGSIGIIPDPKRENPHARMLGYWLKEELGTRLHDRSSAIRIELRIYSNGFTFDHGKLLSSQSTLTTCIREEWIRIRRTASSSRTNAYWTNRGSFVLLS